MNKKALISGIVLMILITTLGAFAAHGLKPKLTIEQRNALDTATIFGLAGSLSLMIISKLKGLKNTHIYTLLLGYILFSLSIYLIGYGHSIQQSWQTFLWPVTPLGGVLQILAWSMILINQIKAK